MMRMMRFRANVVGTPIIPGRMGGASWCWWSRPCSRPWMTARCTNYCGPPCYYLHLRTLSSGASSPFHFLNPLCRRRGNDPDGLPEEDPLSYPLEKKKKKVLLFFPFQEDLVVPKRPPLFLRRSRSCSPLIYPSDVNNWAVVKDQLHQLQQQTLEQQRNPSKGTISFFNGCGVLVDLYDLDGKEVGIGVCSSQLFRPSGSSQENRVKTNGPYTSTFRDLAGQGCVARVLHNNTYDQINTNFFIIKLTKLLQRRERFASSSSSTNQHLSTTISPPFYRLVNSDGDEGMGGLIVDRFGDGLALIYFLCPGLALLAKPILEAILQVTSCSCFVLWGYRLWTMDYPVHGSKNKHHDDDDGEGIIPLPYKIHHHHHHVDDNDFTKTNTLSEPPPFTCFHDGTLHQNGCLTYGSIPPTVLVSEGSCKFEINPTRCGHPGWYFDRKWIRQMTYNLCSPNSTVLDLFAGIGAFGIGCAKECGASLVVCVDNDDALAAAGQRSAHHSGVSHQVQFERANVAQWVEDNRSIWKQAFDVVILDPPSRFTDVRPKCCDEVNVGESASVGGSEFHWIIHAATQLLKPTGFLVFVVSEKPWGFAKVKTILAEACPGRQVRICGEVGSACPVNIALPHSRSVLAVAAQFFPAD